jgi:hypothetical protein
MRIRILKNKPLNEEEVVVQQSVDVATTPAITFESNPLEFILQKYPSLNKTLVDLMTEDFRDYISGIYVMAPKPTIFKVVLHNNRVFYLTFMGKTYEAKVSGKKYYLARISELEMATLSIADLLTLGTPPQAEGPTEELASTPEETDPNEPSAAETPAEEEVPEEELTESKKKFRISEVKKPFSSLSPRAQEVGKELIKQLDVTEDDILYSSSNRLILLSDQPRLKVFQQLEDLGYIRDKSISGSGQGGFKTDDNIQILVKPKSGQGAQSSGKQNEASFFDLINNKVEENGGPITVVFKSNKKNIKVENVASCRDSSVEGATEFAKADAQLLDPSGKVLSNISLKQRNAVRWESSKSRLIGGINIFKNFIEKIKEKKFPNVSLTPIEGTKNKFKLYDPQNNKILSKVIIKDTPPDVINDVVFGNDDPKTIVIKEDFEGFNDYTFENGLLTINCYKIYTDVEDLIGTDDEPVFAFSNHIGQAFGIEFRSFSKGLLYKDDELKGSSAEISFNDLK